MMWWCLAAAIALLLASSVGAHAADDVSARAWEIGPYRVTLAHVAGGLMPSDRLRIWRGDRVVYATQDRSLAVSPNHLFVRAGGDAPVRVGADLLGLGLPVLAIERFSGGAHCCFAVTLVVLGRTARVIPTIDGADSGVMFVRWPGERALVAHVWDPIFAYYRIYFAASRPPEVTLRFDPRAMRYVPAPDLMRRPAPSALAKAVAAARAGWPDDPQWVSPPLLHLVGDPIYTGHLRLAHEVTRRAWRSDRGDPEAFWHDLTKCQLRRSAYWPAVATLNGLPALKPALSCRAN
ncbi:MAG: hypothetical protein KGJ66_12200 [Alphaproteobacteria bacterium]|nr:hypothetical protein [Alphaproteobacteria bacterium]